MLIRSPVTSCNDAQKQTLFLQLIVYTVTSQILLDAVASVNIAANITML